jgi:hypothetical protein
MFYNLDIVQELWNIKNFYWILLYFLEGTEENHNGHKLCQSGAIFVLLTSPWQQILLRRTERYSRFASKGFKGTMVEEPIQCYRLTAPTPYLATTCLQELRGAEAPHFLPAAKWITKEILREMSVSHGDEYEDRCLLTCCTVQSGRYWPTIISLMIVAVSSSETSVSIHQTTRCYRPADSHLEGFWQVQTALNKHDNCNNPCVCWTTGNPTWHCRNDDRIIQ